MSKFSHFDLGPFARLGFRSPWWLIGHCWLVHNTVAILEPASMTRRQLWPRKLCRCRVCRMGNQQSGTRSAKTHIALLGDSTIDNGRWVPRGEPSVFDQVGLSSHWVMLRALKTGWILIYYILYYDILYVYLYNCMYIYILIYIYIYWCNNYWWISDGSRLDGAIDRCSSWSRTSHCVLETELWYLAWPGINSNPGHSDPFRCSTDSTKMQLGQNSTEAVVARACDFYKQYVMFDIIALI